MRRPILLTLFGLVLSGLAGCGEPALHGARFEDPTPAPRLALTHASGTRFDLQGEQGKLVLLFFGYTHCPDICPTTLSDWARAKKALGADTTGIRWVFVSVDPQRDTPAVAARYAARFDPAFIGLSGSVAQIDSVKTAWGIPAWSEGITPADTINYTVSHPGYAMLVGRDGRLRVRYPFGVKGDDLASDLRALQ